MEESTSPYIFLKSLPIPHKSFLLPSIIPNILCYWKILTPLGPIQICDILPVLHIIADERIFWLAFQQRTNKNQVQQNKKMFQYKSSFCPTELKYHSHHIYHDMNQKHEFCTTFVFLSHLVKYFAANVSSETYLQKEIRLIRMIRLL